MAGQKQKTTSYHPWSASRKASQANNHAKQITKKAARKASQLKREKTNKAGLILSSSYLTPWGKACEKRSIRREFLHREHLHNTSVPKAERVSES